MRESGVVMKKIKRCFCWLWVWYNWTVLQVFDTKLFLHYPRVIVEHLHIQTYTHFTRNIIENNPDSMMSLLQTRRHKHVAKIYIQFTHDMGSGDFRMLSHKCWPLSQQKHTPIHTNPSNIVHMKVHKYISLDVRCFSYTNHTKGYYTYIYRNSTKK